VQYFLDHVAGIKHRAILLTCYGAGLRISEAIAYSHRRMSLKRGAKRPGAKVSFLIRFPVFGADQREACDTRKHRRFFLLRRVLFLFA
jgi:site-specific recombinase XerC